MISYIYFGFEKLKKMIPQHGINQIQNALIFVKIMIIIGALSRNDEKFDAL
jgi:hypothetical protein